MSARRNASLRPPPEPSPTGWWLGIFLAAAAVRLLYLASISGAPFFRQLQTNAERYHLWALAILRGGAPPPPFEQAPGYPYLVALVYALAGPGVARVAALQAFLGAGACLFIAVAAHRLFGRRAGIAAGLLAVFYGPFIYFSAELLPATAFVFVVSAALAVAADPAPARRSRPRQRERPADTKARSDRWLWYGGLWSLALLVRSNAILAYPFVAIDAWMRGGGRAVRSVAIPCAVCVLLFAALNLASSGRLVLLTTSGGVNLWLGNSEHADGVSPFVSGPRLPFAESVRARSRDAVEADELFRREASAYWARRPGDAARLAWKKLVWTWTQRELPNNADIEWRRRQSWLFPGDVFPLHLGYILPLAAAAVPLLGAPWRRFLPLLPPVAVGLLSCVVFFTNARFRLPMAPALLVLAGAAIDRCTRPVELSRRRVALGAAALLAGVFLSWGDFYGVRSYRIPEIEVNTGILERESGRPAEAVPRLRAGLAGNPQDAIAWVHLALALEQSGEPHAALQSYLDGLVHVPHDQGLREMAARFFLRHGFDVDDLRRYLESPSEDVKQKILRSTGKSRNHVK